MPTPQPSIELHFLAVSDTRAVRLFWLLEELGLKYKAVAHLPKNGGVPPSLKEITPLGKSPVAIIDGEMHTESGSIIHELIAEHPMPGLESTLSATSHFWSLFSEGSLSLHLQPARVMAGAAAGLAKRPNLTDDERKGLKMAADWLDNVWCGKNVVPMLERVETFLQGSRWFTGGEDIGEGDFMMAFPLHMLTYGLMKGKYPIGPATTSWVDRVRSRPAWQAGIKREGEAIKEAKQAAKGAKL